MATLNVLDYGAVGDGVADDTDAIMDAIDATSDGDTVYLPETDGFYRVTQRFDYNDNDDFTSAFEISSRHSGYSWTLEGDGPGTKIMQADGDNARAIFHIPVTEGEPDKFDIDFKNFVLSNNDDSGERSNQRAWWINVYSGSGDFSGHDLYFEDIEVRDSYRGWDVTGGGYGSGVTKVHGKRISVINTDSHGFTLHSSQDHADVETPDDILNRFQSVHCENNGNPNQSGGTFHLNGTWAFEDVHARGGNHANKISNDNVYGYFRNATFTEFDQDSTEGVWYETVGGSNTQGDLGFTLELDTVAIRNIENMGAIRSGSNRGGRGRFFASGPLEIDNVGAFGIYTRDEGTRLNSFGDVIAKNMGDSWWRPLHTDDDGDVGSVERLYLDNVQRDPIADSGWDVGEIIEGPVDSLDTPGPNDVGAFTGSDDDDIEAGPEPDTSDTEEESDDSSIFDDWTPQWDSDQNDWGIVSGDAFEGERALVFEHDGDAKGRYGISCDTLGEPSDVELLDRFQIPTFSGDGHSGLHARTYLRSSGNASNENGYWVELENESFRLGKYSNGDLATLGRFGNPEEDTVYHRRFRAEGDEIKAKVWPVSESEPSEWDIEVVDSDHDDGWFGLGSYAPEPVETDVVSVATGGHSASISDTSSSPTVSWVNPIDGATVSGSVTVQIDAVDPAEADGDLDVAYRFAGGSWSSAGYNPEIGYYEDTLDTTSVGEGTYTLEARASNSEGTTEDAAIDITVEESFSIATVDARDVSNPSATLVGEVTSLNSVSSASCGFEWRESGTKSWNVTEEQTVSSVGEFSDEISGLDDDTEYEFRAVASEPERLDARTGSFYVDSSTDSSSDEDVEPVIEQFDVQDRSNPAWNRYDVDWTVSHDGGDLDTVVTKLRYEGSTVDAESTSITGETASYSHLMRVRGPVDEVVISVNDTENRVTTERKSV